jgi:hypothetical protein
MSFSTHTIITPADLAKGTGFAASLKKLKSAPATLVFTLRPPVAAELGWAGHDRIEVAIGDEEHHGLVRLRKSETGTAALTQREAGAGDGKRGGPYFQLNLGFVPMFVDRSEEKRWVLFDQVEDGWVEVVLPAWADETGPRARTERPRLSAGVAALPPPSKPAGKDITARMMGDPPAGRSALATSPPALTRGDARRRAEAQEALDYEPDEAADWNRKAASDNRLADLMQTFALTRSEGRLVDALLDGKLKSRESLHRAAYSDEPTGGPDIKIIDVFISKIRKKLKIRMVEIGTVQGTGYRMEPPMVARVMVLSGAVAPDHVDDGAAA